jgi:hypothetical protein
MWRSIKNFTGLVESPSELGLFLRIGIWIALVTVYLRLASMNSLMRLLQPKKRNSRKWPQTKLVNFTSFWLGREKAFFQRSCLKRSLVLFRYLNLQDEDARFVIGVRKEGGELRGHSWILLAGQSLFPDDDLNYRVIFSFPPEGPVKEPGREASSVTD